MSAVHYSLEIKIALGAIEMWELLERKLSGTKVSTKKDQTTYESNRRMDSILCNTRLY